MIKKDIQRAKKRVEKIRQLMSKTHSPYKGMAKQEIIEAIRKIRERLWEDKLAAHSR